MIYYCASICNFMKMRPKNQTLTKSVQHSATSMAGTGQASLTSASLCYESVCLSILDLQSCPRASQRALCCAVSLACKEILPDRRVRTLHMGTSHQTPISPALQLPIGLQHKTVFTDANRWISIIRSPLLRSREGMQGPK